MSVIKLGWKRSGLFVIFLRIRKLLQKLSQILDAPVKGDSVVLAGIG